MLHAIDYLYGLKGTKRYNKHNILNDTPHPNSLSGYILLKEKYRAMDEKRRAKGNWRVWLTFRNKFLRRMKRKEKTLRCHFCEKTNLFHNHNSFNAIRGQKATVDHYIPLSKGGAQYDERNLVVCCDRCNAKKADTLPEEWKQAA